LILLFTSRAYAQHPLGIFADHTDIGQPKLAGSASYNDADQSYTIRGAGYNIWFNRDEFHYVYRKIGGDFILTADFAFTGDTAGVIGHRKTGWMIRESTDADAAGINACKHIDGLTALQWRELRGAYMQDPKGEVFWPKKGGQTIQLERNGKTLIMRVAHPGEPLQVVGAHEMPDLPDSILVGLYVCAHDSGTVAEAKVWNVRIDRPVANQYYPNPQLAKLHPPATVVLNSRQEVLDISSGVRRLVTDAPAATEGKSPYTFYSTNVSGTEQLWRMKPDGSAKEQLTFDQYHNWFPHLSPDGKWIVFLSYPPDIDPNTHPAYQRVMLRLMPTGGGAPRSIAYLYGGEGSLGKACWSTDSKYVYFADYPVQ
jgi:hypothetical protein